MLKTSDLEKSLQVSSRWVRKKTEEAFDQGKTSIKLKERNFSFELVNGAYVYEELLPKVIETEENESSRAWKLASEEKQREALDKERLIRDYKNRPNNENWKKFLLRVERKYKRIKPTKSKLFRWLKVVDDCEANGLVALHELLDTRGKTSSNRSYTDAQYEYMEKLILEDPEIQAVHVHQYMEQDYGKDEAPSYATVVRMMKKWKKDPNNILIYSLAVNPSDTVSKYRPAHGRADSEVMHTNALWELDGTPADVICSDGIRYSISAAIDVYSRRVVWVLEPSSSAVTLGRMLKKGIEKFGIPQAVLCDQGKEYKSKNFAYTCARLQIEQRFTPPFAGYMKPHIERFFGTMTRDLFSRTDGFIGYSVAHRERIANRKTFSDKKESQEKWLNRFKNGDEFARKFANKKENVGIDIHWSKSRDELELLMETWTTMYENRHHRGIDTTPMKRWNSCGVPQNRITDSNVLNILVGSSVKKKITKKGITWNKITYINDLFYDMGGQSVWVLSDDDLGVIYVYDLDMNFVCRAENQAELGKSRSEYGASRKFDASVAKKQRKLDELRANKPKRLETFLDGKKENAVKDETVEFAIEHKSEAIKAVENAVVDGKNENIEVKEEVVLVNGRPIFNSLHERFMWDFKHDMVDESTKKLAEKKERIYKMALEEWEERKLA